MELGKKLVLSGILYGNQGFRPDVAQQTTTQVSSDIWNLITSLSIRLTRRTIRIRL